MDQSTSEILSRGIGCQGQRKGRKTNRDKREEESLYEEQISSKPIFCDPRKESPPLETNEDPHMEC